MYQPFRTSWQTVIRPSTSFPLPPLKFRTASFPQYGFKPAHASATFTGRFLSAYRPPLSACRLPAFIPQPAGPELLMPTTGPVALGSHPVLLSGRFIAYYGHICASVGHPSAYGLFRRAAGCPAQPQRVPNLLCQSFHPCRHPYPGGPSDCTRRCLHRWFCLHHISTGSATTCPTNPERVGRVTKLQPSLNVTAWGLARPALARTFTAELAWAGSPRKPTSAITGWLIVIYHRRTLTGWTGSLMGCELS